MIPRDSFTHHAITRTLVVSLLLYRLSPFHYTFSPYQQRRLAPNRHSGEFIVLYPQ